MGAGRVGPSSPGCGGPSHLLTVLSGADVVVRLGGAVHAAMLPTVLARTAPSAHGGGLDAASGVIERAAQKNLDLGVDRAQVVRRPLGDGRVDRGVQPEQDLLACSSGHGYA